MARWALAFRGLRESAVTQRQLFATADEGYRIRIITHRLFIHFFHQEAVSQTSEYQARAEDGS